MSERTTATTTTRTSATRTSATGHSASLPLAERGDAADTLRLRLSSGLRSVGGADVRARGI
jgi:hypothetical protein